MKAVLLDRDGTILRDAHYLSDPNRIHIYKGVIPALKGLKKRGWKVIIATNQSGIARGYLTLERLEEIHRRMLSIFKKNKLEIDEIYFCPHHPDDHCLCRKPNTGMLLEAAKKFKLDLKKSVVIGDNECDILWGKNGGTKTILVLSGKGKRFHKKLKATPDHVSTTLVQAIGWILKNDF